MCGFSILIEPIYRGLGKYRNATFADIMGGMMADVNLLNSLSTAVGDLADSFVTVPKLRGLAERVYAMESSFQSLGSSARQAQVPHRRRRRRRRHHYVGWWRRRRRRRHSAS
jgi:hypothetical protein